MNRRARVVNLAMPNESGNKVIPVNLGISQATEYLLEAWISNFGGCNIHILEGKPSLKQAEEMVKSEGPKDIIMTVTGAGTSWVPLDITAQEISVYFEGVNKSEQTQVVAIEVKEC